MVKTYRTIQNDTFDLVAFRLWGNEHMCRHLMAANPDYMDVLLFPAGVKLNVPDVRPQTKVADLPPWYEN